MKKPDFIVIGAQKSGTTALFKFLSVHPEIYLPPQKEVQFFSVQDYFERGVEWYSHEFYRGVEKDVICGDISPQYMFYKNIPNRIKETLPNVKLIAIVRHPIERAYSHYNMSVRRGQETRSFFDAFNQSVQVFNEDKPIVESESYYRFSNYADILTEYLKYFSKEEFLILFQEDLSKHPIETLKKLYKHINITDSFIPNNPNKKIHQGGVKRYPKIEKLLTAPNFIKSMLKPLVPTKWRAAFRFSIEQINIKPIKTEPLSADLKKQFDWVVNERNTSIENLFEIKTPWK